jgi:hypothetical protein
MHGTDSLHQPEPQGEKRRQERCSGVAHLKCTIRRAHAAATLPAASLPDTPGTRGRA